MSYICAISGETAENPVVSPVSGRIFERRLIEKYLAEHGTDPTNARDLQPSQLVALQTDATGGMGKPRSLGATSIPSLLKMLQDEWDACMLHSFALRQQLHTARQELSHTLYQHDAACRVIARLSKELTAAREALATLKPQSALSDKAPSAVAEVDMEQSVDEAPVSGINDVVLKKLQDKAAVLTAARKQRGKSVPEKLASPELIRSFTETLCNTGLHSASAPGITALDLTGSLALTGGIDKTAVLFNLDTEKVEAMFKGHGKRVTAVLAHASHPIAVTASADATVRVWTTQKESNNCRHVVQTHDGSVNDISLHATGDYVLSVATDAYWALTDINVGRTLCKVRGDDGASGKSSALTCGQFHPDGLIFGVGLENSLVKIWDLKEQNNVANFPGHEGAIKAIAFSENGYYLATAADDATVKLWDLRKLKNFKTLTISEQHKGTMIDSIAFDQSGSYMAVAGSDIQVFHTKQWTQLARLTQHTQQVTAVRFGENAETLVSTGLDRALRVYRIQKD